MAKQFKTKYILAIAVIFSAFLMFLLLRSFSAVNNIYLCLESLIISDPFWISIWLVSAIVGEVGLIFRFAGATFFLAFAYLIVKQNKFTLLHLRRAVFLEGSYYLFMVPFILSLLLRPNTNIENLQAGASYTLQLLLISPAFIILNFKLKKPRLDKPKVFKWGAICIKGFTFALWVKHFIMTLYALPINLGNSVLAMAFLTLL